MDGDGGQDLAKYLEAKRTHYDACLDHVEHSLRISDKINANLNLHFVKFDGNGEPKFSVLAKTLVDHIISYSIALSRRKNIDAIEAAKLFQEARNNFNLKEESGEPGEVLLYFLLETVIQAPQLICKIDLKTNRKDEVKGADGIHAIWDQQKNRMVLFIGESKLHADFSSGVKESLASIEKLYEAKTLERDLLLATKHFKHADGPTKERILKILDQQTSTETYEVVHACLIGYEWQKYADLQGDKRKEFIDSFEKIYLENIEKHRLETLQSHLDQFKNKHLSFHFFFLPFKSLDEFRKAFNDYLTSG